MSDRKNAMSVLFASSEVAPWSKTGGLADVCAALPKALDRQGLRVSIVTPYYRCVRQWFLSHEGKEPSAIFGLSLHAPIARERRVAGVRRTTIPGTNVVVYFIEHNDYFDREGIYNYQGVDYQDNCDRYAFFCRCVLELVKNYRDFDGRPFLDVDVIHVNDWQTALVPVYLDAIYRGSSRLGDDSVFATARPRLTSPESQGSEDVFANVKTTLTIHNLRHQGRFFRGAMDRIGLDWSLFTYDKMEFYGQLNLLKSGIVFSDLITTVSPRYAEEIRTEQFGERLQGVIAGRSENLFGVLNGIDQDEWNPKTDRFLPQNYDVDSFQDGKRACKAALQQELGLPQNGDVPLFGVVSRLDAQKGLDFGADLVPYLVERYGGQLALLGSGDQGLADRFQRLAWSYPRNVAVRNTFSIELSHRIEAGADVFLMPSRYEPCGLNQMYSLRYGTLPLVHDVGGLHDTVVNASNENIANGTANGFVFYWPHAEDMRKALDWATDCFYNRKDDWNKIVRNAMRRDCSWDASAREYVALYQKLTGRPQ